MGSWSIELGDCIEVLEQLEAGCAAAVVTDPPFTAAGGSTNGRSGGYGHTADSQFFEFWFSAVMTSMQRVVRPDGCMFVCCDWKTLPSVGAAVANTARQTARGWELTQALVWDRGSIGLGSPFRNQFEMIAFIRGPLYDRASLPRDLSTVLHHRWPYGSHENHSAEKPGPLMRDFVRWATWDDPGALVLDPFAGSGTVGVACAAEGRAYFGVEKDEGHHQLAVCRVEAAYHRPAGVPAKQRSQASLFGGAP